MSSLCTGFKDLLHRIIAKNPTMVVQTLSQIGYEPQPRSPTLWFDYYLFYPNPFRVIVDVVRNHGVLALWHGTWERLLTEFLFEKIIRCFTKSEEFWLNTEDKDLIRSYAKIFADTCGWRMVTNVLLHPLNVITLRKLLQLASAEAKLSHSPVTVALQIWREEGWLGFYSGLTATLLSDVIGFVVSMAIFQYQIRYPNGFGSTLPLRLASYTATEALIHSHYALWTVETVMMSGPAGPPPGQAPHMSCLHCLWDLALQKRLYRGVYTVWWDKLYSTLLSRLSGYE